MEICGKIAYYTIRYFSDVGKWNFFYLISLILFYEVFNLLQYHQICADYFVWP